MLDGLYKVWPRSSMRIRPAKVKIKIGEPFYARDILAGAPQTPTADQRYEMVTQRLKNAIAQMIVELRQE